MTRLFPELRNCFFSRRQKRVAVNPYRERQWSNFQTVVRRSFNLKPLWAFVMVDALSYAVEGEWPDLVLCNTSSRICHQPFWNLLIIITFSCAHKVTYPKFEVHVYGEVVDTTRYHLHLQKKVHGLIARRQWKDLVSPTVFYKPRILLHPLQKTPHTAGLMVSS